MKAHSLQALPLLLIALDSSGSLMAQTTPFPEFTGQRVYVRGVEDVYSVTLKETIDRIENDSPQTYYAVVVKTSGRGRFATRNYIDALWERWLATARRAQLELDPARSVVILLALENRQLSVHGGTTLQSSYGLRGQTIDREIVRPHFIPHARAGDYLTGMTVLIGEIERWIVSREERHKRQLEEEAARRKQAQKDAAALVAKCEKLHADATRTLGERRQSGLQLDEFAEQLRTLDTSAREVAARVDTDPFGVLRDAKNLNDDLVRIDQALIRIGAQQNEASARLAEAEADSGRLEESIAGVRRSGVAVGSALSRLDEIQEALRGVPAVVAKNPTTALTMLSAIEGKLRAAEAHVEALPGISARARDADARVGAAYTAVLAYLARNGEAGLYAGNEEIFADLKRRVERAKAHLDDNCELALMQFSSLEERLATLARELDAAWNGHRFITRTVPITTGAAGLALVLAILGFLRFRHVRAQRTARQRLAAFSRRVVTFLDKLDALRRRHELLPFTDEDFKEPMAGETLVVYESIEAAHARLRHFWLALMETREQGERLLATSKPLGTANAKEVLRLLEGSKIADETESDYDRCIADIETLESAHEEAEAALKNVEEAVSRVHKQLASIEGGGLPTTPYDPDVAFCRSAIEDARAALTGDPIGARTNLERTFETLVRVGRWTERILNDLAGADEVAGKLNDATDLAREKRASGMLLSEEEGDPDPPIGRGRDEHAAAVHALERGDAETAERHLREAFGAADRAQDVIRRQVEAREFCLRELPARRQESERLRGRLAEVRSTHGKLEESFAADSWGGVAPNSNTAESLLETLDPMMDEADTASHQAAQRYFQAADLLGHVGEQQQRIALLLAAVDDRLKELRELGERCRRRHGELDGRWKDVGRFVAAHGAIVGDDANRLLATVDELRHECDEDMSGRRPHWPAIEQRLDQIDEGLDAAQVLAEDDVRHHGRLVTRLEEVRAHAASVTRLLDSSSADRARANQCHHEASAALERLVSEVSTPHSDWKTLLDRLEGVAADLRRSERWAEEDIRLAEQAASAIDDAHRECQRARGFFRSGVSADVAHSHSLISQSRDALSRRAYEEAIRLATGAERSARDAYDQAARAAKRVQRERERARRRAAARRRQSTSSFGSLSSGFGSSSSSFGSSSFGSSSSSFSSGSSSSSWSSGSSQSSW